MSAAAVVVVDTRERRPWRFPAEVETVRAGLPVGDYSAPGLEEVLAVERKSLPDFVASVTHERERFWRELERLAGYHRAAVIVEADAQAIFAGRYRSRASPRSVWASLLAITADFKIPVLLAGDEERAAASCLWLLRRWCAGLEVAPAPHAAASSTGA